MKKLIKKLKSRRGTTLMELIIGMLISVIIAAFVSAVLAPMLTVFNRSNDLAEINTMLDSISEEMINDFSRATAITVEGDKVTVHTNIGDVIYTNLDKDYVLNRDTYPVFDASYYKGKSVSVEFSANGEINAPFYLTLTVYPNRHEEPLEPLASRSYAVAPLFLKS